MTAEENSAMAWDYYLRIDTVTSVCLAYKLQVHPQGIVPIAFSALERQMSK